MNKVVHILFKVEVDYGQNLEIGPCSIIGTISPVPELSFFPAPPHRG